MKTAILTAIGATVVDALPSSIQEFQSTLTSIDSIDSQGCKTFKLWRYQHISEGLGSRRPWLLGRHIQPR